MAALDKFLRVRKLPPLEESDAPMPPAPTVVFPRGRRAARKMRRRAMNLMPNSRTPYNTEEAAPTLETSVHIASLAELVEQFPHLISDTGAPAGAGEEEPPVVTPWLDAEFTRMVENLPEVHLLSDNVPSDQALARLKMKHGRLPLLTVHDENFLLQEAGDFAVADGHRVRFPPCRKDDRCAARMWNIPGAPPNPPVLTQLMYDNEIAALLTEGTPPLQRRMCILCCRLHTYEMVLSLRFHADTVRMSNSMLIQLYRNIAGRPGGYQSELCLLPTVGTWEGFLDPIAKFQPYLLRWNFNAETQRWGIDQSLMVFRPVGNAAGAGVPRPFETPADFRQRSEAALRDASTHRALNRVQCLLEALAPPSLRAGLLRSTPPVPWLVACIRRGGYEAAVLLDALMMGNSRVLNVEEVICEDSVSIPQCHVALLRSSLWVARTNAQGANGRSGSRSDWVAALSHLVGKSAPFRCMTRRFPSVCLGLLEQFEKLDNCMRDWTLCSLLGNYRVVHTRDDVLPYDPDVRRKLYAAFESNEGWASFKSTLSCVLVFVVREMIVSEVCSSPSMLLDLDKRMHWNNFASAVSCTMTSIRIAVYTHLRTQSGWPTAESLAAIVDRGHHDVLSTAQKRPPQPLVRTITGQALKDVMGQLPHLMPEVRDVICQWTRALPPGPAELGVQLVPWLQAFGVTTEARAAFWRLCVDYERDLSVKRELQERLTHLAGAFPRAMSVVYTWCKAYRDAQRCVQWILPQHYLDNQVAAIRGRLGLTGASPIPDYTVTVKLCRGCACLFDGAYVWAEPTAKKPLRAERKIIRGSRTDLRDDTLTCDQCEYDELRGASVHVVLLLGSLLVCRRGLVLLCPQPNCGYPMVIDSRCIFTEFGIACASCTIAATERPPFALMWDKTCSLCHKRAREPRLFPPDITVCEFHVKEEVCDNWPNGTREENLAWLRSYAERLKTVRAEMNKGANTRRRNAERSRNRMTGRQRFFANRG